MARPAVPNDAHLIQIVRGALGRDPATRGLPRPNVSSCKLIVSLHGSVPGAEESRIFEEAVLRVPGVRGVENKLLLAGGKPETGHRLFS